METFEYTMTTDPTPHTERAAAAAAEIANLWLRICKEPPCGCDECQEDMAAIIAKHFPDDAAKDAYHYRYALILAGCPEDDVDNPPDLINWARRNSQQHDALRLAAGRALEAISFLKEQLRHVEDLRRLGIGPTPSTLHDEAMTMGDKSITALSAALAGEQKGKE